MSLRIAYRRVLGMLVIHETDLRRSRGSLRMAYRRVLIIIILLVIHECPSQSAVWQGLQLEGRGVDLVVVNASSWSDDGSRNLAGGEFPEAHDLGLRAWTTLLVARGTLALHSLPRYRSRGLSGRSKSQTPESGLGVRYEYLNIFRLCPSRSRAVAPPQSFWAG